MFDIDSSYFDIETDLKGCGAGAENDFDGTSMITSDIMVTDNAHDELAFYKKTVTPYKKQGKCLQKPQLTLEENILRALVPSGDEPPILAFIHVKSDHHRHPKFWKSPPHHAPGTTTADPRTWHKPKKNLQMGMFTNQTIGPKALSDTIVEIIGNHANYTVIHDEVCHLAHTAASPSSYIDSGNTPSGRGHCNGAGVGSLQRGQNKNDTAQEANLYPTYSNADWADGHQHRVLASHMMVRILLDNDKSLLHAFMPADLGVRAIRKNEKLTNENYNKVVAQFATVPGFVNPYILEDMYQNWIWQITLIHMFNLKYGKDAKNTDVKHKNMTQGIHDANANLNAFARLSCIIFSSVSQTPNPIVYTTITQADIIASRGHVPLNDTECYTKIVEFFYTNFWLLKYSGQAQAMAPRYRTDANIPKSDEPWLISQASCARRINSFSEEKNKLHNQWRLAFREEYIKPRPVSNAPVAKYPECFNKSIAHLKLLTLIQPTRSHQELYLTEIIIAQLLKASGDQSHLMDFKCKSNYLEEASIYPIIETGEQPLCALTMKLIKDDTNNNMGALIFIAGKIFRDEYFTRPHIDHYQYKSQEDAFILCDTNDIQSEDWKANPTGWVSYGIAAKTPSARNTSQNAAGWANRATNLLKWVSRRMAQHIDPRVQHVFAEMVAFFSEVSPNGGGTRRRKGGTRMKLTAKAATSAKAASIASSAANKLARRRAASIATIEANKLALPRAASIATIEANKLARRSAASSWKAHTEKNSFASRTGTSKSRLDKIRRPLQLRLMLEVTISPDSSRLFVKGERVSYYHEYVKTFISQESKDMIPINTIAREIYFEKSPAPLGEDESIKEMVRTWRDEAPPEKMGGFSEEEEEEEEEHLVSIRDFYANIFDRFFDILGMLEKIEEYTKGSFPHRDEYKTKFLNILDIYLDVHKGTASVEEGTPLQIYIEDLRMRLSEDAEGSVSHVSSRTRSLSSNSIGVRKPPRPPTAAGRTRKLPTIPESRPLPSESRGRISSSRKARSSRRSAASSASTAKKSSSQTQDGTGTSKFRLNQERKRVGMKKL